MPPKRKEKDTEVNGTKKNDIQADHELFLQAFEKPTQIYRYLRTRNMISPIFLNRNLTYMKHRMSRTNKRRSTFRVDSMLATKTDEQKKIEEVEQEQGKMKIEVFLVKSSLKKRKDIADIMQVPVGSVEVMVNPNEATLSRFKVPVLSIATQKFDCDNQQTAKYSLYFKIESCLGSGVLSAVNGHEEPPVKRAKLNPKSYSFSLAVINKNGPCLLSEAEYEMIAEDATSVNISAYSPKKLPTWESMENFGFFNMEDLDDFDTFSKGPMLKFRLRWTKEPLIGLVEYKSKLYFEENGDDKENVPKINGATALGETTIVNGSNINNNVVKSESLEQKIRIVYQFHYNNNSRQQTEPICDFLCPWCSVNCQTLYPLVKHLKLCHARFVFKYLPIEGGARIDVGINDTYDGSYTGSPHDLLAPMGLPRTAGPKRRSTVTNILVCHPRRCKMSMSEFLVIEENEFESQRPYISGHNRLYYHTMTCLPILPKELDIDSEGESDPNWLQHKTVQMIDEFTDVNPGEKDLMKMWNLHVMKYGFVGDVQIPLALDMFLDQHGCDLLGKQLYRNFLLHMSSLFDYGLISPEVYFQCIQKLQRMLNSREKERLQMTTRLDEQANHWAETGIFKHIEQQRLLEEKKAKEKEEEMRKKHEPTPELPSFSITASDSIKAVTLTPSKTVTTTLRTSTTVTINHHQSNRNSSSGGSQTNHNLSLHNHHCSASSNIALAVSRTIASPLRRTPPVAVAAGRGLKRKLAQESESLTRRRSAGSLNQTNSTSGINANSSGRRSTQFLARRRSLAGTVIPANLIDKLDHLNPKIVLTRNKTNQMAAPSGRTRTSTAAHK